MSNRKNEKLDKSINENKYCDLFAFKSVVKCIKRYSGVRLVAALKARVSVVNLERIAARITLGIFLCL